MAESNKLRVGDRAPEFTLTSATGAEVSLGDYRGRSEVILFFFPKAYSPFCTAEACSFKNADDAFREAGAEVIGISDDSVNSLKSFGGTFRLPYALLSDPDGEVRRRYHIAKTFGLFPGRATFLIDRQGMVAHIFSSQFLPTRHAAEMLQVLKRVRESG